MDKLIIECSKYVLITLMVIYTLQSILIFAKRCEEAREFLFIRQNVVMFCLHFVAFMVLYLQMNQSQILFFYGEQALYLAATLIFFRHLYPKASKLAINNMCMLITIGFIMVTRLSYDQSVKQFQICVIGTVIALIVPWLISKLKFITKFAVVYAILGIGLLVAVAVMATVTNGAKLSLTIAGITLQPSEFVKIIYVFCIAGMLSKSTEFSQIVKTTILAAVHVLILVISTDLGSALIYFMTYLIMLYVATRDWKWLALDSERLWWQPWQRISCLPMSVSAWRSGKIHSVFTKEAVIRWHRHCLRSRPAVGSVPVCIRDHRPRSLMWIRTLCLRRSPKRWEVFSAFARF